MDATPTWQRAAWVLLLAVSVVAGCADRTATPDPHGAIPPFPERPVARATPAFRASWQDGRAELSGYHAIVPRYGALREAELVLVYVTEPMDRRTWIKDDDVRPPNRVDVLKLNVSLKFLTGIYPYSIMTSVFAPIDAWRPERFTPTKITLTAQEWCGHVFAGIWPGEHGFESQVISYFASEGERREHVPVDAETLYEDALWIQLRELDGPFAGGRAWSGRIVPSLWNLRRAHDVTRPVQATIRRSDATATVDGAEIPVTRFVLTRESFTRTYDVERAPPRRIVAVRSSDGEQLTIARTARLAYWELNGPGGEQHRAELGLPVPSLPAPVAPADVARIGR